MKSKRKEKNHQKLINYLKTGVFVVIKKIFDNKYKLI